MTLSIAFIVNIEIEKLLDVGFISIDYSPWISNIVVISKGENNNFMCNDYWDLKKKSFGA